MCHTSAWPQVGAAHVYGIDASSIADQAQQIVKENGFEDTVSPTARCSCCSLVLSAMHLPVFSTSVPSHSVLVASDDFAMLIHDFASLGWAGCCRMPLRPHLQHPDLFGTSICSSVLACVVVRVAQTMPHTELQLEFIWQTPAMVEPM